MVGIVLKNEFIVLNVDQFHWCCYTYTLRGHKLRFFAGPGRRELRRSVSILPAFARLWHPASPYLPHPWGRPCSQRPVLTEKSAIYARARYRIGYNHSDARKTNVILIFPVVLTGYKR